MVVDVVDTVNRPVDLAQRADLLSTGKNFRTVHVILYTLAGEIVLQKLRSDHDRSPGKLGSSAAGYVQAGETYEQAAARKVLAELGSQVSLRRAGMFEMKDGSSLKFVCVFTGAAPPAMHINTEEISGLVYMLPKQLAKLIKKSPDAFTKTFQCLYASKKSIFKTS